MTLSKNEKKRIAEEETERLRVQEEEKQKKRRIPKWALIGCGSVIGLFVIIIIIIVAASASGTSTNSQSPMQATTAVPAYSGPEVEYEVTGNVHAVSVTLGNATGGTEQYNNYALPFRMSYNSFPASFLYISAQNQGEGGYVTVNIYYEGQLIKTSTSSGSYTIATASDYK